NEAARAGLQQHRDLDEAESGPAGGFRQTETEPAEVADRLPRRRVDAARLLLPCRQPFGRHLFPTEAFDRLRQRLLFWGKGQLHWGPLVTCVAGRSPAWR